MSPRHLVILLAAALSCFGACAAHARTYLAPTVQLGQGHYVHRFVLRDPHSHRALPNTRYQLTLPNHVTIADQSVVQGKDASNNILGKTDAAGRTVRVRLPRHYPENEWDLIRIVGPDADMSISFRIINSYGKGGPEPDFPYVMDMEDDYLVCGYTNANARTYSMQSYTPRNTTPYEAYAMWSHDNDDDWCNGPGMNIADNADKPGGPDLYTQYLGTLVANGHRISGELRGFIVFKLVSLAIAERDSRRIDLALDTGNINGNPVNLDDYSDDSDDFDGYSESINRAQFNAIIDRLIDANLNIGHALTLLDTHLSGFLADPNALRSKGWALYHLGRNEEALTWIDRSITALEKEDPKYETEYNVYQVLATSLSRKGEVLDKLGRHDDALAAFKRARDVQADNPVLNETLKRLNIVLKQKNETPSDTDGK